MKSAPEPITKTKIAKTKKIALKPQARISTSIRRSAARETRLRPLRAGGRPVSGGMLPGVLSVALSRSFFSVDRDETVVGDDLLARRRQDPVQVAFDGALRLAERVHVERSR